MSRSPQRLPLEESHALDGIGAYAKSKIAAESRVLARASGDAVVLRLFNLTGPGQSERFALADWAKQSIQGAQDIRTGNLTLKRDYLDVREAAQGIWSLSQRASGGDVVNVCSGNAYRLSDLFAKAAPGCRPSQEEQRLRADDVLEIQGALQRRRRWLYVQDGHLSEHFRSANRDYRSFLTSMFRRRPYPCRP